MQSLSLTTQPLSLLLKSLSLPLLLKSLPGLHILLRFRTVVSLIVSNGILNSVTHYFYQFNSVLIIIDLVLVLGLEGLVLDSLSLSLGVWSLSLKVKSLLTSLVDVSPTALVLVLNGRNSPDTHRIPISQFGF